MAAYRLSQTSRLVVESGDLTKSGVDAIVNAANEYMLGGGGVDGAIHQAAGPELLAACSEVSEVRPGIRCPTGEARVTPGFRLRARYVIHTVGPVYRSDEESAPLLIASYRSCIEAAQALGVSSLAFPAISCGVYGYPMQKAATLALRTCREGYGKLSELRFVLFGADAFRIWSRVADAEFGIVAE